MSGDEIPGNVLQLLLSRFEGIEKRLSGYVTTESFSAEQGRVNDKIADLGSDIRNEQLARETWQVSATKATETAQAKADAAAATAEQRKVSFRQGLTITLVGVLAAGVLGLITLIIENASHLVGSP